MINTLNEMTDKDLYELLVQVQEALLEKRNAVKEDLEKKETFGIQYLAIVNEVDILRKELNTLKVFQKNI